MTTRGFRKAEAEQLANLIADVLEKPGDEANLARVADDVKGALRQIPGVRVKCPFCASADTQVVDYPGQSRSEHRPAPPQSA
jgi:hypothetical protein